MSWRGVRLRYRPAGWGSTPKCARPFEVSPSMAVPSTLALPLSGVRTPYSMRKQVDLPAPLAPNRPVISPSRATKDTSRTASMAPKRLLKFAASITPKRLRSWCRTYHVHKKGRRAVAFEAGRIELVRRRCVQKLRHQPRYTAGGDLAVSLAPQYQVPMARKSASRACRIGGGRPWFRLSCQQQCPYISCLHAF